ncbi:MAG: Dabb family protein [Anaeroplasmataceae bacterium]
MLRHIVIWKIKDDTTLEQLQMLKEESESLKAITHVIDLEFVINPLSTSSHDMMLNATYEDASKLEAYRVDPIHVEFGKKLRPLVKERVSFDYEF